MRSLFFFASFCVFISGCSAIDTTSSASAQISSPAIDSGSQSSDAVASSSTGSSSGNSGSGNIEYKAWWDGYSDPNGKYTGATLTRVTLRELDRLPDSFFEIVPKDHRNWCPAFPRLSIAERKAFYLGLISGIARYETDFRAHVKYLESGGHYSRGLLQLGQLALSYYPSSNCDVSGNPAQLHDVRKNITCGAMLIRHWVTRDEHVASPGGSGSGDARYLGAARYWSTLRKGRRGYSEIGAYTRDLPVCKR